MSQAKVDKYKEAKAHRKETMKKEKTAVRNVFLMTVDPDRKYSVIKKE